MIYLASDHRGFDIKEKIKQWLKDWDLSFEDKGPFELDNDDDYPDWISKAAREVSRHPDEKAIVLGYSGQGEAIVANKYKGVRAIVYYGKNDDIITLSREHNDANVLSIGAGFVDEQTVKDIIKKWLDTPFSKGPRHIRRINKIKTLELTT